LVPRQTAALHQEECWRGTWQPPTPLTDVC
jgi:hypothetical protein